MGCFASEFDREEFTFAGQKHCIRIENLTPVFPEGEKAAQKRRIEGNLFEIFSRSLYGEETS